VSLRACGWLSGSSNGAHDDVSKLLCHGTNSNRIFPARAAALRLRKCRAEPRRGRKSGFGILEECIFLESQRDSATKPRVARNELPWV